MSSSSARRVRALSVAPAAAWALGDHESDLIVDGVFPSAINLEVEGNRRFVTLCGARGVGLSHAVVLNAPGEFTTWHIVPGARLRQVQGVLEVPAGGGSVAVDLAGAVRPPRRELPAIGALGAAHRACVSYLAKLQEERGCELRMGALLGASAPSALGKKLRDAATAAVNALASTTGGALSSQGRGLLGEAVGALVGLGPGLTPSGDDFLCGMIAALRARPGSVLAAAALPDAAEAALGGTSKLSAFLIRCAVEGYWPTPLVELAEALSDDNPARAGVALFALCELGHSSGADLATGFLYAIERWVGTCAALAARQSH